MDITGDLDLLAAVVIAIAGIAGALILRGWLLKLAVLGVALAAAGYVAGFLDVPFLP